MLRKHRTPLRLPSPARKSAQKELGGGGGNWSHRNGEPTKADLSPDAMAAYGKKCTEPGRTTSERALRAHPMGGRGEPGSARRLTGCVRSI